MIAKWAWDFCGFERYSFAQLDRLATIGNSDKDLQTSAPHLFQLLIMILLLFFPVAQFNTGPPCFNTIFLLHPILTSKLNDLDLCSFFIFDMWSKDDDCRVFVIEISTF